MKRLIRSYLKPHAGLMSVAIFFMIIAAAMTAAIAQLMQPVLDDVLGGDEGSSKIWTIGFAVFGTFLARGLSTYAYTIIMSKLSQTIVANIQKDLFAHFLTLDLTFFHTNPSGQLISRVVNDVQVIRNAITDCLTGLGKSLLTLVFLVAVMFYQDWKLSVAAFIIFPFASIFVAYIGRRLRKVSRNIQQEFGNLTDRLSQIFQGIRQVQAYGMEEHEKKRAGLAIEKVTKLNVKAVRIGNMSTPVNEILIGLVACGIIVYGGFQVASGEMTTGQLVAFLGAFTLAYEPMKRLAKLNNTLQSGMAAAERVFAMMDLKSTISSKPDAIALDTQKPSVVFKDVEFQYETGESKALQSISFTAEPGKVTALVGHSGGGKTTVINLIPRFYDVQGGQVLVDGHDVRDLDLQSLRRSISLVSQDITIFDDSIGANIAYGRPEASKEEIIRAAKLAAADDFIRGFPEGYQTRVGEDGVKLSGGQRQRIAIARALLHNAPILLLDEATSALDNESELAVQQALRELEKGRTTLVIAHRLSTVQSADQIIVLEQGRIAERGTHSELISRGGIYAKMYEAGLKQ